MKFQADVNRLNVEFATHVSSTQVDVEASRKAKVFRCGRALELGLNQRCDDQQTLRPTLAAETGSP
jgi:hypothetical protein